MSLYDLWIYLEKQKRQKLKKWHNDHSAEVFELDAVICALFKRNTLN